MKARLFLSVVTAFVLLVDPASCRADDEECSDPVAAETYACREVVVELLPGTDAQAIADRHGLRLVGTIPQIEQAWFEAPVGTGDVPALILELLLEPGVVEAERNGKLVSPECRRWAIADIPLGPDGRLLFRTQPALAALRMPAERGLYGLGITVAVLDTGIARSSPEIPAWVLRDGIDVTTPGGAADDPGNGIDDNQDGRIDEGRGHGTAVASLVSLVAPGATLLPVRVLDDECQGTAFSFASGVVRAADAGAQVINLSFGSLDASSVITNAVRYATDRGVLVFAPAGNGDESSRGREDVEFPAKVSLVFAVTAVDDLLVAPAWTNRSSKVSIVAPGVDVIAPRVNGYARLSGTSFSTAFASGVAASAWEVHPGLGGRDIGRLLEDRARSVAAQNPGLDGRLGNGIPDLTALREGIAPLPRLTRPRLGAVSGGVAVGASGASFVVRPPAPVTPTGDSPSAP